MVINILDLKILLFGYMKSYNIPEKPINLIIRWNILEKYATKSFDLIGNLVA